jgi:phytoene/squalene synthetase
VAVRDLALLVRRLEARSQSNLYFALALLPWEAREAFRDVYRFLRAADDLVDSELPALSSEDRRAGLADFHRVLDVAFGGTTQADLPLSGDLVSRLAQAIRDRRLTRAPFDAILAAIAQEIDRTSFATDQELLDWCRAQSGTLGILCAQILGVEAPAALAYAEDMGTALQLANILRDVQEDAARGHVYLPESLLARHGASVAQVVAGRPGAELSAATRELGLVTRRLMAAARVRLAQAPAADQACLLVPEIWADVYLAVIDALETRGWDPTGAPPRVSRPKKLLIALARARPRPLDFMLSAPRKAAGIVARLARRTARDKLSRLQR